MNEEDRKEAERLASILNGLSSWPAIREGGQMTPEGKVKSKIKEVLDKVEGLWYFMPVQNGYGKVGIPDFVGCYKGAFFAIEAKAAGKATTQWQLRCHGDILESGGRVIIANGSSEIWDLLETMQSYPPFAVQSK